MSEVSEDNELQALREKYQKAKESNKRNRENSAGDSTENEPEPIRARTEEHSEATEESSSTGQNPSYETQVSSNDGSIDAPVEYYAPSGYENMQEFPSAAEPPSFYNNPRAYNNMPGPYDAPQYHPSSSYY